MAETVVHTDLAGEGVGGGARVLVMVTVPLLLPRLTVPEMLTEPVEVLLLVVLTVLEGVVDWLTESTAVPLMVGEILEVRLGTATL